jgi:hypothetical protein
MSRHQPDCGATIYGAYGITPCNCDTSADLRELADVIRREVRLSAGIEEGQEFQCDWTRVAESALATVHGRADLNEGKT